MAFRKPSISWRDPISRTVFLDESPRSDTFQINRFQDSVRHAAGISGELTSKILGNFQVNLHDKDLTSPTSALSPKAVAPRPLILVSAQLRIVPCAMPCTPRPLPACP